MVDSVKPINSAVGQPDVDNLIGKNTTALNELNESINGKKGLNQNISKLSEEIVKLNFYLKGNVPVTGSAKPIENKRDDDSSKKQKKWKDEYTGGDRTVPHYRPTLVDKVKDFSPLKWATEGTMFEEPLERIREKRKFVKAGGTRAGYEQQQDAAREFHKIHEHERQLRGMGFKKKEIDNYQETDILGESHDSLSDRKKNARDLLGSSFGDKKSEKLDTSGDITADRITPDKVFKAGVTNSEKEREANKAVPLGNNEFSLSEEELENFGVQRNILKTLEEIRDFVCEGSIKKTALGKGAEEADSAFSKIASALDFADDALDVGKHLKSLKSAGTLAKLASGLLLFGKGAVILGTTFASFKLGEWLSSKFSDTEIGKKVDKFLTDWGNDNLKNRLREERKGGEQSLETLKELGDKDPELAKKINKEIREAVDAITEQKRKENSEAFFGASDEPVEATSGDIRTARKAIVTKHREEIAKALEKRKLGGPVETNKQYIAGEEGREIFISNDGKYSRIIGDYGPELLESKTGGFVYPLTGMSEDEVLTRRFLDADKATPQSFIYPEESKETPTEIDKTQMAGGGSGQPGASSGAGGGASSGAGGGAGGGAGQPGASEQSEPSRVRPNANTPDSGPSSSSSLPSGTTAADIMANSIMAAETGNAGALTDQKRFIRTKVRPEQNKGRHSSAYGPVQMTKGYLDTFKERNYDSLPQEEQEYLDKLINQGQQMLKNPNDPTLGYGGKGTLGQTERDRQLYSQVAKRSIIDLSKQHKDYKSFIKNFRGEEDKKYFDKIAKEAEKQGKSPEDLFNEMKQMKVGDLPALPDPNEQTATANTATPSNSKAVPKQPEPVDPMAPGWEEQLAADTAGKGTASAAGGIDDSNTLTSRMMNTPAKTLPPRMTGNRDGKNPTTEAVIPISDRPLSGPTKEESKARAKVEMQGKIENMSVDTQFAIAEAQEKINIQRSDDAKAKIVNPDKVTDFDLSVVETQEKINNIRYDNSKKDKDKQAKPKLDLDTELAKAEYEEKSNNWKHDDAKRAKNELAKSQSVANSKPDFDIDKEFSRAQRQEQLNGEKHAKQKAEKLAETPWEKLTPEQQKKAESDAKFAMDQVKKDHPESVKPTNTKEEKILPLKNGAEERDRLAKIQKPVDQNNVDDMFADASMEERRNILDHDTKKQIAENKKVSDQNKKTPPTPPKLDPNSKTHIQPGAVELDKQIAANGSSKALPDFDIDKEFARAQRQEQLNGEKHAIQKAEIAAEKAAAKPSTGGEIPKPSSEKEYWDSEAGKKTIKAVEGAGGKDPSKPVGEKAEPVSAENWKLPEGGDKTVADAMMKPDGIRDGGPDMRRKAQLGDDAAEELKIAKATKADPVKTEEKKPETDKKVDPKKAKPAAKKPVGKKSSSARPMANKPSSGKQVYNSSGAVADQKRAARKGGPNVTVNNGGGGGGGKGPRGSGGPPPALGGPARNNEPMWKQYVMSRYSLDSVSS